MLHEDGVAGGADLDEFVGIVLNLAYFYLAEISYFFDVFGCDLVGIFSDG